MKWIVWQKAVSSTSVLLYGLLASGEDHKSWFIKMKSVSFLFVKSGKRNWTHVQSLCLPERKIQALWSILYTTWNSFHENEKRGKWRESVWFMRVPLSATESELLKYCSSSSQSVSFTLLVTPQDPWQFTLIAEQHKKKKKSINNAWYDHTHKQGKSIAVVQRDMITWPQC